MQHDSFKIVTWLVEVSGSTMLQSEPERIYTIFWWLRSLGALLWLALIGVRIRSCQRKLSPTIHRVLVLGAKLYVCTSVSIATIISVAIEGYLVSIVSDKELFLAELGLFKWGLELLLCWAIGFAIYCTVDFTCVAVERRRASMLRPASGVDYS